MAVASSKVAAASAATVAAGLDIRNSATAAAAAAAGQDVRNSAAAATTDILQQN